MTSVCSSIVAGRGGQPLRARRRRGAVTGCSRVVRWRKHAKEGKSGALRLQRSIAFLEAWLWCPKGVKSPEGGGCRPRGHRWPFGTPSTGLSLGQVARQQSLPPFHPAATEYRPGRPRTSPRQPERLQPRGGLAKQPGTSIHMPCLEVGPTTCGGDTGLTPDILTVPEMRTFLLLPDTAREAALTARGGSTIPTRSHSLV